MFTKFENPKIKLIVQQFTDFKLLIDEFPSSFKVIYVEEQGYILTMDLDSLESHLAAED